MPYVGKLTAAGNTSMPIGSTLYGTCDTAAATAAKVVTCAAFNTLETGVTIHVKFTNSNTVANPTLNVNSTGAKSIYRYGTTVPGTSAVTSWYAGAVVSFTYDGSAWQMNDHIPDTNTNTTYSAGAGLSLSSTTFNHSNSVTAGTAGTSSATSGSTLAVPYITYDAQGHITATGTHTHTVTGFAASSHTHDDRYYTESEINTKIANMNKEAYLEWGGKNFAGSYGPIDAAMVQELGANRLAFIKASALTIEYTRDGGSTWTDYGATDVQKTGLFGAGQNFVIGKADNTNKATANGTNYQLRVTIDTGAASVYTVLNKFVIYISTNGSSSCTVKIQKALQSTPTTFVDHTGDIEISGWSGYNVINVSGLTTYGNTAGSQYGRVRFIFKANGGNTNYPGMSVSRIMGFGGVGWSTPSNMSRNGHMYSYDNSQNVTFPANVTATKFIGPLQGNADTATSATSATTATTAVKPKGFSSQADSFTWGNQTGTALTVWNDSTGGSLGFRRDNPSSGQVSQVIDGTVYIKEGAVNVGDAIKSITRSGTTFTYTTLWGNTGTFTQQDNNTTYSAGTGLSLSSTTFSLAASGATAGSYGPSANASPAHSGTFSVPYITVDAYGRITAASTKTITLPADNNTTYPIYNKTLDANYLTTFRTEAKGNSSAGQFISNIRTNTASIEGLPQYGAGLAFGTSDTHGYVMPAYSANGAFWVGGGNADKLNWKVNLMNGISNITRSGTTFTATRLDGTTFTFTQQDNNTTYSAGTALSLSSTTFNHQNYGTAGTAGTSSATSGSTIAIPYITFNAQGHETAYGTHTHTVTGFAASSHTHDDRYYTETEMNTKLAEKASASLCTVNSGNKSNYPWHRFATCTTGTGSYTDKSVIVVFHQRFNDGKYGAVKLSVRTNASGAAINTSAKWIYRVGFAVGDVVIDTTSNTTGTNTTINAYVKCTTYMRMVGYIYQGSNNGWTLVNSNEPSDTTTSDKKGGTEINASVSPVANATDVGTVNYANSAGDGISTITRSGTTFTVTRTNGTTFTFTQQDNNTTYNFSGTTFYSGNSSTAEHNANNAVKNGNYYYTSNGPATSIGASTDDGALYVQSYSDSWVGQIAQDYRNGCLFVRGKNNGTWKSWYRVHDTGHSMTWGQIAQKS